MKRYAISRARCKVIAVEVDPAELAENPTWHRVIGRGGHYTTWEHRAEADGELLSILRAKVTSAERMWLMAKDRYNRAIADASANQQPHPRAGGGKKYRA